MLRSVRLSVCPVPQGKNGTFYRHMVTMLEIQPIVQHGPMTTGSGRNSLDLEKKLRRQYIHNEDRYSYGYYQTQIANHRLPIIRHNHGYCLTTGKVRSRLFTSLAHLSTVNCHQRSGGLSCRRWATLFTF